MNPLSADCIKFLLNIIRAHMLLLKMHSIFLILLFHYFHRCTRYIFCHILNLHVVGCLGHESELSPLPGIHVLKRLLLNVVSGLNRLLKMKVGQRGWDMNFNIRLCKTVNWIPFLVTFFFLFSQ